MPIRDADGRREFVEGQGCLPGAANPDKCSGPEICSPQPHSAWGGGLEGKAAAGGRDQGTLCVIHFQDHIHQ